MTQPLRPAVLVVDDDEGTRDTLELCLKKDCRVIKVADGETALEILAREEIRVILLDIRLPGIDGMEVLRQIKEHSGDIEVVMVTWVQDLETAVEAMKLGAYDYIPKEFDYDRVRILVRRILEGQAAARRITCLEEEVEQLLPGDFLVGRTSRMQQVLETARKVAPLPTTVLLTGESGTGKELMARFIHREGGDPGRPFVAVNLAAIPAELIESTLFGHEKGSFTGADRRHLGKFELANGGTLFLDEVADLRIDLQAKLLRVIQEEEIERVGGNRPISVEVRLITATSRDLSGMVRRGELRDDLYWRLRVVPIELPSLRERRQDIPALARLFLERYSQKFGKKVTQISEAALEVLSGHDWPGNIRELENLIERLVAMADGSVIFEGHIPIDYYFRHGDWRGEEGFFEAACRAFERNLLLKALTKAGGSRAEAARMLGLPLSTLRYKLISLGLAGNEPGPRGLTGKG